MTSQINVLRQAEDLQSLTMPLYCIFFGTLLELQHVDTAFQMDIIYIATINIASRTRRDPR